MIRRVLVFWFTVVCSAYDGPNETRQVLSLDGVWRCYCEEQGEPLEYNELGGLRKVNGSVKIAVPGGHHDVVDQIDLKICRNVVWYERNFFVPTYWRQDQKIQLRLERIPSETVVWLNGIRAGQEQPSEMPIELDVTERLLFDSENRLALSSSGAMGVGIPYSISLRTVPEMLFIQDVSVNTTLINGTGTISYRVTANGLLQTNRKCITVQVLDMSGIQVAMDMTSDPLSGIITIPQCSLWWPTDMELTTGYLYTLVFRLHYKFCDSTMKDVYRKKVGFRSLHWSESTLTVNGKIVYLRGVETSTDWARTNFSPQTGLRDMVLLKWLNANAIATNSMPSEEMLDIADEQGLMVVLGSPLSGLEKVVTRYRNHPSVISWSILMGDSCNSTLNGQCEVSKMDIVKALDNTRPFTGVLSVPLGKSELVDKLDIVCLDVKDVSGNSSLLAMDSPTLLKKPMLVLYGGMLLSERKVIRSINHDPYDKFDSLQRNLNGMRKNISIVGEFFGNFVAYKRLEDIQGDDLHVIDGLFNRNREPTLSADFVRFKFKGRRSPCAYRPRRCKYEKKVKRLE